MAANNIYIQVDLNSSSAQQNVNALNQAIASTGPTAEKSSKQTTQALSTVQVSVQQTTRAFGELTTALAGLGISRVAERMLQSSAEFSRAQQAITLFAGSAESARKVIEQVQAIARQSPFHFAELQQTAREMLGFGIAAKDVPIHLKAITDQVTAMGGTMEDVSGIVRIYGRIMETDIVSAMTLIRKLPQEGVPVMKAFREELSKSLGRPVDEKDVLQAMQQRLLDPTQTLRVLTEAMSKAQNPTNDAARAFKNLGDEIKLAFTGPEGLFGEKGFGPAFTKLAHDIEACLLPLENFIDLLKSVPEPVKDWTVRIAAIGAGFTALAGGAAIAATVFGPLITAISGFIALLPEVLTVIGAIAGIGAILYKTVPGVKQWADNIKDNIDGLKVKAGELQQSLADALNPQKLAHGNILNLKAIADALQDLAQKTQVTADASKRQLLDAFSSPVEAVVIKYDDLFKKLDEESRLFTADQKRYLREVLAEGEAADLAGARFKAQKEASDEFHKYEAEKTKGSYEMQIAYIEALDEQGVQKRVAAIDKITELRIASVQKVAAVETDHLTDLYNKQVAMLEDLMKQRVLDPDQVFAAEMEMWNKLVPQRQLIEQKSFDETQKYRLEGWKKANDAIIEDQKRVFEEFQNFFDQIFDAFTGKSKDIGKAITDIFKKELLGEARNIFSSALAQGATAAAGYGTPEADFRRSGGVLSTIFMRGTPPRPPMAPPGLWNPALGQATLNFPENGPVGGGANRLLVSADTYSNATTVFAQAVAQFAGATGPIGDQAGAPAGFGGRQFRRYIQSGQGGLTGPEPHITLGPMQAPIAAPDFPAFMAPGAYPPLIAPLETYAPGVQSALSGLGKLAVSGPVPLPASTLATAAAASAYTGDIFNLPTTQRGFVMPPAYNLPPYTAGIDMSGLNWPMQQGRGFTIPPLLGIGGGGAGQSALMNLKGLAGNLRNFVINPNIWAQTGTSFGAYAGSVATSPAASMVGTLLATGGLLGNQRGTGLGVLEGFGGGALMGAGIGAQFGPEGALLGAGIGAAAGFGIGLGEMLAGVESPRNKVKRLASQLYHININNATADAIANLAQQSFGGNVGVAMRSPQVRQMLGVYAAGTGQANQFPAGLDQPHGASLVESGGMLQQQATYQSGNPYTYSSNLPIYGGAPTHILGAPGGGMQLSLNINGDSAAQFLQGNVVSPSVVQAQYATAMQSSNGRVPQALMMSEPGTIVG
jgi:hypothetical protein